MDETLVAKRSANLLFVITALFWCSQYTYTQFINPELERMGMNAAYMGLVSGTYGFTQTLFRIPLGIFADRLGKQKPFVIAGCALSSFAALIFLTCYTPGGFLLARGLSGAASASWVSFTVLYGSYFSLSEGPRKISALNTGNMGGRLAGYLLVLYVIPVVGIGFSFSFSLVASLGATLLSLPLTEKKQSRQGINLREFKIVSKDPYLRVCSLLGILTQAIAFSTYYGFNVNVAKNLGADTSMLIWMAICLLIPTLALNVILTSNRFKTIPARSLVTIGFLFSALYCLLIPLCYHIWHLLLCQGIAGLTSALTFSVLLGQCVRDIPGNRRAVAMGFYQSMYGIGMTLGPIVIGQIASQTSLRNAFWLVGIISLLSAFISWKLMKLPLKITLK